MSCLSARPSGGCVQSTSGRRRRTSRRSEGVRALELASPPGGLLSVKILSHWDARLEAAEAARHDEEQRMGRGVAFMHAVGEKLEDVARMPGIA